MVGRECQRRAGQRRRDAQIHLEERAEVLQQAEEITGPAHRHRRGGHAVFQHQVPADEPRHQFAERRIGVGIGAAGDRYERGEFGVAQRGERAADRRQDEGKDHRRAGMVGRCLAGDHEDAAADHCADTQCGQPPWSEGAAQGGAVGVVGFVEIGLACEQLLEHGKSSSKAGRRALSGQHHKRGGRRCARRPPDVSVRPGAACCVGNRRTRRSGNRSRSS